MLIRVVAICALLITCKEDLSQTLLTDEQVKEIKNSGAGASTDMFIDDELNVHMRFAHFLPTEPGEITGATVELEAYADIELGAPNADGVAEPIAPDDGEIPTGKWLRVNLKNDNGELCKVVIKGETKYKDVVYQLQQAVADEHTAAGLIYYADDRICVDDHIVPMRVLNTAISEYAVGGALPEPEIQARVHDYMKRQKNFLEANQERDDVKEFQLRAQMLDSYFTLRNALGDKVQPLGAPDEDGYNARTLLHSVLGAFISDSHNAMPSEEILQDDDSVALQMTKLAIAGAVSRFLMYQLVFDADEFAVAKYREDFNAINWHDDLRPAVVSVENNFPTDTDEVKKFSNTGEVKTALDSRINYMNQFMRHKMKGGDSCEQHVEELYQGLQHPEIYAATLAEADAGFSLENFEQKVSEHEGILLMTTKALGITKLGKACDTLNAGDSLDTVSKDEDIQTIVTDVKQKVLENLEELNNEYSKGVNKKEYLPNLIASHMFALPPVLTFSKHDMSAVVAPLVAADEKFTKKEKSDRFWSGFTNILGWVVGILGIIALVSFLFPPAMPIVAGLASVASLLSLAGTAILVPTYTTDYFKERSEYRSLERSILSGSSKEYSEQIQHLAEFRAARNEALIYGATIAVAAVPVTRLVKNPRDVPRPTLAGTKEALGKVWGQGTRPFKWAGRTIRHPIKAVKRIPNNASRQWENIKNGLANARSKAQGLRSKKIKSTDAVAAKRSISKWFTDSTKSIREGVGAAWKNNLVAWRSDDSWKILQKAKKANKELFKDVKFGIKFNENGSVLRINNRGSSTKVDILQKLKQAGFSDSQQIIWVGT
ncbi:MAG: hypothetical protein OYH77_06615 [Pseudomonadota bacterium]|nr:hypothetical protein [Pseudomonadota bacterium]